MWRCNQPYVSMHDYFRDAMNQKLLIGNNQSSYSCTCTNDIQGVCLILRLRCLSRPRFYYMFTCKIEAFISFIFSDQNCVIVGHGCFLADPSCYTYAVTITIACLKLIIISENSFFIFSKYDITIWEFWKLQFAHS